MTLTTRKLSYTDLRYTILNTIHQNGTTTTRGLLAYVNVSRPSLSRCITRLERSGLIIRNQYILSLSSSGQQILLVFATTAKHKNGTEHILRLLDKTRCMMNDLAETCCDMDLVYEARALNEQISEEIGRVQP